MSYRPPSYPDPDDVKHPNVLNKQDEIENYRQKHAIINKINFINEQRAREVEVETNNKTPHECVCTIQ